MKMLTDVTLITSKVYMAYFLARRKPYSTDDYFEKLFYCGDLFSEKKLSMVAHYCIRKEKTLLTTYLQCGERPITMMIIFILW